MAYTALYRKLRPNFFKDVVGQRHIVTTLINQIINERISHAYLFCGTRGTGKTSMAKIFSKAVSCTNPIEGEPCNECESCLSVSSGSSLDVIEIDAASNNGVDNIRDIREEVKYAPTISKYRIFIIDEVHMLTTGAFNALLKTLEEPPPFVLFILATTDPQKIPATVLSRVQRFDFHRISKEDMLGALKKYTKEENIVSDESSLSYICDLSDGAMRDALSILDQCASFFYGEELTIKKVRDIVGAADINIFFDFINCLNEFDNQKCMSIIEELVMKGKDIFQFVNDLLNHLRNVLIYSSIKESLNEVSDEMILMLKKQGEELGVETILYYLKLFSILQTELKYSSNQRILLEICCFKILNPETASNESSSKILVDRINKLEKEIERGEFVKKTSEVVATVANVQKEIIEEKNTIEKAVPDDIMLLIKNWEIDIGSFKMPLKGYFQKAKPCYLEGSSLVIVHETKGIFLKEDKNGLKREDLLKEFYKKKYGKDVGLVFLTFEEYDARHNKKYGASDEALVKETYTDLFGSDILSFE